jgi:hypothetical protein
MSEKCIVIYCVGCGDFMDVYFHVLRNLPLANSRDTGNSMEVTEFANIKIPTKNGCFHNEYN